MVKSAKLWREISLQHAKLNRYNGLGSPEDRAPLALGVSPIGEACHQDGARGAGAGKKPRKSFYDDGLMHRHWVLVLCSGMMMAEWMDRSVLSISLQAMKEEFHLTDLQTGLMASSSLWIVPLAVTFMGRVADFVPKAKMLACGVLLWGVCTIATGSARSFQDVLICRIFAGLANCAGYPVAVSLLAEFFEPTEMTTAIGYFNAGCGFGGLLGLALGGWLITDYGWRYAFWCVGVPQLAIAALLATTVRSKPEPSPQTSLWADVMSLIRFPSLRYMLLAALLSGLMSGNHRFISALVQRLHHVTAQYIGSYMGVPLGLAGVAASWTGGHVVDHFLHKSGDGRMLFWCAAFGDMLHMVFGTLALLSPEFWQLVVFLMVAAFCAALNQGIDTANQQLGRGRRGTTQAMLECGWAVGMAIGPFMGGAMSDTFVDEGCDEGCALARSLLIVSGLALSGRAFAFMMASKSFRSDVQAVDKIVAQRSAEDEGAPPRKPSRGLDEPPGNSETARGRPSGPSSPSRGGVFCIGGDEDLSPCAGLRDAASEPHGSDGFDLVVADREASDSPRETGVPRATRFGRSSEAEGDGEREAAAEADPPAPAGGKPAGGQPAGGRVYEYLD